MNKNIKAISIKEIILVTVILGITVIISFISLNQMKNTVNEANNLKTGGGSTVQETQIDLENDKTTENKEKPKVVFIDQNNPLEKVMLEDKNVDISFLKEGNEIHDNLVAQMKKSTEAKEIITIQPSEEGKKIGAEPLELIVTEYYPLMVFNEKDAAKTGLVLEDILKSNKDMVYVYEKDGLKYFAFKDPLLVGGIKRVQKIDNETLTSLKENSILVSNNFDENKETLIFVEDPLCPFCSQSYLKEQELLEKYNVFIELIALDIKGHENSEALSTILLNNKDNKNINTLLKTIFEKQSNLTNLSIKTGNEVKDILNIKNDDFNYDIANNKYNAELFEGLANKLGVSGTPTKLKLKGNIVTLITAPEIELK